MVYYNIGKAGDYIRRVEVLNTYFTTLGGKIIKREYYY